MQIQEQVSRLSLEGRKEAARVGSTGCNNRTEGQESPIYPTDNNKAPQPLRCCGYNRRSSIRNHVTDLEEETRRVEIKRIHIYRGNQPGTKIPPIDASPGEFVQTV